MHKPIKQNPMSIQEKLDKEKENQLVQKPESSSNKAELEDDPNNFPKETAEVEGFSNSMNRRKHYKDVADAAHEAFMSAAYAAAAARAAVELSRSSPRAPDDANDPKKQVFNSTDEVKPRPETSKGNQSGEIKDPLSGFDKVHSFDKYSVDSDDEETENETKTSKIKPVSAGVSGKDRELMKEAVYDDSDDEDEGEKINSDRGTKLPYLSQKKTPYSFEADSGMDNKAYFSAGKMWLKTGNRPVMRTRR